jgi:chromosome segregation ATPase
VALLIVSALVAGCGSSSSGGRTASSKQAIESLRGTRQELAKAKTEVQQTNGSLDKLASGGNLEQSYQQYTRQVAEMKASGERAKARGQDMRNRTRQYVAAWQKEMDQISSPELRAGASERRAKVQANFDQITASARATGDAYRPYLQNLQEIQKALANDLTPAGVDAARTAIDKAKAQGETVQQKLDALIAELDQVGGSMSTGASTASGT